MSKQTALERLVRHKRLPEDVCRRVCMLQADEHMSELIESLKPSANMLRDLLILIEEIAARDGKLPRDVLSEAQLKETLEANMSAKQRQAKLKFNLRKRRFPILAELERKLEQHRRELLSVTGLGLVLPQELEGDSVSVTIKARSVAELEHAADSLKALAAHPSTSEILGILRGEQ